jgi:regulator of extracellular matrix RemA (YlzA/DUF370 family)
MFLNVGFFEFIVGGRILGIFDAQSKTGRKIIQGIKQDETRCNSLYNMTHGRRGLSLIVMDGPMYVLSAVSRTTLVKRALAASDKERAANQLALESDDMKPRTVVRAENGGTQKAERIGIDPEEEDEVSSD